MLFFIKSLIIYAIGIIISLYVLDELINKNLENRTATITIMSILWFLIIPLGILLSIIEFIKQAIKYHKKHRRNK